MLGTETLALGEQVVARELATPVSFRGLLQVTEPTHAGETENGAGKMSVVCPEAEGGQEARRTIEPF